MPGRVGCRFPGGRHLVVLGQNGGCGCRRDLVGLPALNSFLVRPSKRGRSTGSGAVRSKSCRRIARKVAGVCVFEAARTGSYSHVSSYRARAKRPGVGCVSDLKYTSRCTHTWASCWRCLDHGWLWGCVRGCETYPASWSSYTSCKAAIGDSYWKTVGQWPGRP